jgi:hypothetical protein
LDDGYFQIEYTAVRPYFSPRLRGIYEGKGDRVAFQTVTPSFASGDVVHMRWRANGDGLHFEVERVEPDDAGFLAIAKSIYESHPLRLAGDS